MLRYGYRAILAFIAVSSRLALASAPADIEAGAPPIRLVLIDAFTEKALGPLPWAREYHAKVIDRLKDAGVRAIGLRFYFRDEQDEIDDSALVKSVRECGSVFIETGRSDSPQSWQPSAEWLNGASLNWRGTQPAKIPDLPYLQLPFSGLAHAARGIGSVDMLVDKDLKLKGLPLMVRHKQWLLPSLALRIFLAVMDMETAPVTFLAKKENIFWIWPTMRTKGVLVGGIRIALDDAVCINADLSAPGSAFQAFSYVDILEGRADPKPFREAVVIIGSASKYASVDTSIGAKNGPELVADQLSALFEFAGSR